MKPNSLTFQLLSLIFGGFIAAAVLVLFLADLQVKKIVDQSQDTVYDEKLATIIHTFEASVKKLNTTGLREAYEKDFQYSALRTLRSVYYTENTQRVYPAILNYQGEIVMHPVLPHEDKSLQNTQFVQEILQMKNGSVNYTYTNNEEKWCRFKSFEEWNWIVIFAVPLDIKYVDLRLLRNRLALTLVGVMIIVTAILSIVISKTIKPISELTKASEAMTAGDLSLSVNIIRKDELGTLAKSFVSMRDSIKEKITALAASERNLDAIIKTVPDIIYRLDTYGNITFISNAVKQYGYKPEKLVGTSVIDLVHHEDKDIAKNRMSERRTKDRSTSAFEVRLLTKDQKNVFFEIFSVSAEGLYSSESPSQHTFLGTQGIARDITKRKQAEQEREQLIIELQDALENIKTLSGLVPICANCKNIRDDKGYWNQIESYIQKYSEVQFTHGICPDCAKKLYPEIELYPKDSPT